MSAPDPQHQGFEAAEQRLLQVLRNVIWGGQRAGNLTNQSFLTKMPDLV